MAHMNDRLIEVTRLTERLKDKYPAEINAFLNFMKNAEEGTALSAKQKELINNLGLSMAAQCEWCIAVHVQHAVHTGASRDEMVEADFQAVPMHGGPALMNLVPFFWALQGIVWVGVVLPNPRPPGEYRASSCRNRDRCAIPNSTKRFWA
jgi:AhpD family alkylhydroperoxidase